MKHEIEKSLKREKESAYLHDQLFKKAFENLKPGENIYRLLEIDRATCDYQTEIGKTYQRRDIDTLLKIEKTTPDLVVVNGFKTVSEKTRSQFYGDIYLEIISVLARDNDKKFTQIEDLGWANKFLQTGEKSAHYLSMVFVDKKNNKHNSFLLTNYPKIKEQLFHPQTGILKTLVNEDFIKQIGQEIALAEKSGQENFRVKALKQPYGNVIGAKNKTRNGFQYYTIGLTFSFNYLKKELGAIFVETKGSLVKNNIRMK